MAEQKVEYKPGVGDVGTFGADVTVPENAASFEFWVEISCDDSTGLSIDKVHAGDVVTVESLSGIGSFTSTSLAILAGFVAIASGVLQDGTSYYTGDQAAATNAAIADQTKKLEEQLNKDIKHKRRDGYGQDPGTDDYAKNEGGIIVCMPKAGGALYATDENHLQSGAKQNGRLPKYFSQNVINLNSFFPCNKSGGQMLATAKQDGVLHIIAFDQKFSDNGGTYEVKINITRPSKYYSVEGSRALLESVKMKHLKSHFVSKK